MAERIATVYGLRASDQPGIRYVGQTSRTVAARLAQHVAAAQRGGKGHHPVHCWMAKVLGRGAHVHAVILERLAVWNEAEARHIARLLAAGAELLNVASRSGAPAPKRRRPAACGSCKSHGFRAARASVPRPPSLAENGILRRALFDSVRVRSILPRPGEPFDA